MQRARWPVTPHRSADFPFYPCRNETWPPASFLCSSLLSRDGGAGDCACLTARVAVYAPGGPARLSLAF